MTRETTRRRWATELAAAARAHWTEERTRALTGGKRLAVLPAEAPLLLRALGLLHRDATMPPPQVRKFLQINHVVRVLEPALAELRARHPVIRIVDAGCGRSYLTLLIAWCARERWRHPVEILGVDRNPDVIAEGRRRTALAGLDDVIRFEAASVEDVRAANVHAADVHAVLALHACDTATCDAIALGVARRADLIAVAPCCQAELGRAWSALAARPGLEGAPPGAASPGDAFAPIRRAPHLRREIAAHVTDAMRALLLGAAGYRVTALEFIAAEHTQKNTLLRAVRAAPDPAARAEYEALVAATGGAGLALADRL
ncbi:MAG TPA: SAM-dependent methyltransferase [Kofleriaceae bacterium]|nr:SAM-dependent methyltransferase [Kofleriaceae bacterium]